MLIISKLNLYVDLTTDRWCVFISCVYFESTSSLRLVMLNDG